MPYTDIGFDEFLNRIDEAPQQQQAGALDPAASDNYFQQFSGNKIQGGQILSPDGRLNINLDTSNFKVNNGLQDLLQFGILEDGNVGLLIKDNDGNILMKVTSAEVYLQSPKKTSKIDLIADQYTVSDEFQNVKVLIGRDVGGF